MCLSVLELSQRAVNDKCSSYYVGMIESNRLGGKTDFPALAQQADQLLLVFPRNFDKITERLGRASWSLLKVWLYRFRAEQVHLFIDWLQ